MQLLIVVGQLGETGRYLVRARERRGHRGGAGVEGPGCRGADDVGALCRGPAPPGPARVSLRVDYDERRSTRPPRSSTTRRAFARSWMRSTDWPTTPARPGRLPTGRLTCGGCGWAGTGSCTRLPTTRSRSATWPAAPETDPKGTLRTEASRDLAGQGESGPRRLLPFRHCSTASHHKQAGIGPSLDLSPVRRAGLNCSAGGDFGVRAVAGCPAVAPAGGVPRAPGIAPSVSQG